MNDIKTIAVKVSLVDQTTGLHTTQIHYVEADLDTCIETLVYDKFETDNLCVVDFRWSENLDAFSNDRSVKKQKETTP